MRIQLVSLCVIPLHNITQTRYKDGKKLRKPTPQQSEKFREHLKKVTGIEENAEGESSESGGE